MFGDPNRSEVFETVAIQEVDPTHLMRVIRGLLEAHPVRWIAPIHGHPIAMEDVPLYLERLEQAIELGLRPV